MKTLFHLLLMAGAVGLGLAVGFVWREKRVARTATSAVVIATPQTASPPKSFRSFSRGAGAHHNDDSPLATQLERDLSMAEGVTRWLYWMEAIENAGPGDFPRLARLTRGNPAAARLLAQRWVAVNPRHLFDTLVAASNNRGASALVESEKAVSELARVLFDEWPKRDPEAAIAALNGPDDFAMRQPWRLRVTTTVFDQDVERGVRLLSEWHIEDYVPPMNAVAKWAAARIAAMSLAERAAARSVIEGLDLPQARRAQLLDMLDGR